MIGSVQCASWAPALGSDGARTRPGGRFSRYVEPGAGDGRFQVLNGVCPRRRISDLVDAMRECNRSRDLELGRQLHAEAVESGVYKNEAWLSNTLITMYANCGSMGEAQRVFDSVLYPTGATWNCLMQGYVDNGEFEQALELFQGMEYLENGQPPDRRTFLIALAALVALPSKMGRSHLESLKAVHSQAIRNCHCDMFVESMLVKMYAECGRMLHARNVFDNMATRDAACWNTLISAYVENDGNEHALDIFDAMEEEGCLPTSRTYVAALGACVNTLDLRMDINLMRPMHGGKWLAKAKSIHSQAVMNNCCQVHVESALIDLYGKCGAMLHARSVFDNAVKRNSVSWNCLIQGYAENGASEKALELLDAMEGVEDVCERSFLAVASAITTMRTGRGLKSTRFLEKCKALHSRAVMKGFCSASVVSSLVKMYGACGNLVHPQTMLDNFDVECSQVAWHCLVEAYLDKGDHHGALRAFKSLKDSMDYGVLDSTSYNSALAACASLAIKQDVKQHCFRKPGTETSRWLEEGKALYSQAVMNMCDDNMVQSAAINLYAKCGRMVYAQNVFDSVRKHNAVLWNCLIRGYVDNGNSELALEQIKVMDATGCGRTSALYVTALQACAGSMALERGKAFHADIRRCGLDRDPVLVTCLMDFYGKVGNMEIAKQVFDSSARRDICAWNTLISGYTRQGDTDQVFKTFDQMLENGTAPDEISFNHILTACSHAGLVTKGREFFEAMEVKYQIKKDSRHYACMVDLLGRANHLDEALNMVRSMPYKPDSVVWLTLLSASYKWKNVEVGQVAYNALVEMDERKAASYVLMANIYSDERSSGPSESREASGQMLKTTFGS